jgi:predicted DNA-binding protein
MAKPKTVRQKRVGRRVTTGTAPTVAIRLPEALIQGMDKLAKDQGVSRSDIMRQVVENLLKVKG